MPDKALEKIVAEMPKAENPHLDHKGARLTPLSEMSRIGKFRLDFLTTRDEAYAFSNADCASARWGTHREATQAQCQVLAEMGWRKVPSEEGLLDKLFELYFDEGDTNSFSKAVELRDELHRWLLEGE